MEPVPYEIREDDIDEVLNAYESAGGGAWSDDERREARAHVMRNVIDVDETVRSAAEDESTRGVGIGERAGPISDHPGDRAPARRSMALAAIEDLLIRDGFIDLDEDEPRVFPVTGERDSERS
ncbi:MAG: hypothetical protein ACRELV_04195 [Longimicrobiales bacterium]